MADNIGRGAKSYLPILNRLLGYQSGWLSADLVARVTDLMLLLPNSDAIHFPTTTFGLPMVESSSFWVLSPNLHPILADSGISVRSSRDIQIKT
jgi:hypothetical protein